MSTIAILGAGNVGRALAQRFHEAGLPARFGIRDPASVRAELAGSLAEVPALATSAAVRGADIVFLAVPTAAAEDALRSAGATSGTIVVDCTNPLRWANGPVWTPPPAGSTAQALAVAFPELPVIKGFNHFGAEVHRQPKLTTGPADAFFAGDDRDAKSRVMELAGRMGFRPHDAGPLRNAALLENLAVLWIQLATVGGAGRDFAFRMDRQATAARA